MNYELSIFIIILLSVFLYLSLLFLRGLKNTVYKEKTDSKEEWPKTPCQTQNLNCKSCSLCQIKRK